MRQCGVWLGGKNQKILVKGRLKRKHETAQVEDGDRINKQINYNIQLISQAAYKPENTMKQIHKIQKQVHTGSILICSNDNKKSFRSVIWNRKNQGFSKQVKQQVIDTKLESVYNCNFYDLGSCIGLQVQSCEGNVSEFLYGPVLLEPKFAKFLENNPNMPHLYPVSVMLNKNLKYSAVLTFNKNQPDLLAIIIKLQNTQIKIQHPRYQHFTQYEQLIRLSPQDPLEISFQVGKDKLDFLKSLRKIKIYCHYGNYLKIYFQSDLHKATFLMNLLQILEEEKKKISTSLVYEPKRSSNAEPAFFSESTQCFSAPKTTYRIPDSAPEDLRNVVFQSHDHPSKEFVRDHGITSLQKLLTPKQPRKSYRAPNTIFSSTALKYSHKLPKSQSPLNLSTPKLKQNTYLRTSLNNTQSKAHTKSTQLSFKELLDRNLFLQDQNRKLLQQNIKLKYKLQSLTGMDVHKDGGQQPLVPNFIKTKHQKGKQLLKSAKTFRQTELRRETEIRKEEAKEKKIHQLAITTTMSKKINRVSQNFFGRQSMFKYSTQFLQSHTELHKLTEDTLE